MSRRLIGLAIVGSLIAVFRTAPAWAQGGGNEAQYRAAITQIFLSHYRALPLVRLNPVFPGTVIVLRNETEYARYQVCYPNLKVGLYKGISSYAGGDSIALSGNLVVGGNLISKSVAAIEAKGSIRFAGTGSIRISPLSLDAVDLATLRNGQFANANCKIIPDLLSGKAKGAVLVQQVLHGRVGLVLTASLQAGISASAQGDLLKVISSTFKIKEADIGLSGTMASFSVSESPGDMSLAIVPTGYSLAEVSRITHYLQGKRGADLEIAVREAVRAGDVGWFEKAVLRVQEIIGNEELSNKERWADNVVGPDSVETITSAGNEKASFERVAVYGAAMELVRKEAPSRQR